MQRTGSDDQPIVTLDAFCDSSLPKSWPLSCWTRSSSYVAIEPMTCRKEHKNYVTGGKKSLSQVTCRMTDKNYWTVKVKVVPVSRQLQINTRRHASENVEARSERLNGFSWNVTFGSSTKIRLHFPFLERGGGGQQTLDVNTCPHLRAHLALNRPIFIGTKNVPCKSFIAATTLLASYAP